jgi:hypothetical protein
MTREYPVFDHHLLAALHCDEAAQHRKTREYEAAAHHVHIAHEHLFQARLLILRERQKAVMKMLGPPSAA